MKNDHHTADKSATIVQSEAPPWELPDTLLYADSPLPLLLERDRVGGGEVIDYLQAHRPAIEAALLHHGGILFRGFGLDEVAKFDALMEQFSDETIPYLFRSSPRYSLSDRVYVSTTYPNERKINMHSESSYSYAWGQKIFFCCILPATVQGETPIADNRRVLASLSADLVEKFERHGVLYQRNLSPHAGLPWQEVFQTDQAEEVAKTCRANGVGFKFRSPDFLTIAWKKPAIYRHPQSGERVWFNHAFFFNRFSLYEEMGLGPEDKFPSKMLSSNTFFGNGSPISYGEYRQMAEAYEKAKIIFPWQRGDLLMLDNMLSAHGRNPYEGDRKIVVSIVEPHCEDRG